MTNVYAAVDQIVVSDGFTASVVCHVLRASRSGFYAWRSGATCRREQRDRELLPLIQQIFCRHKRRYGARRIAAELARKNIAVGVA